jgi:Ca2+-binding RTX toxin-like protein
VADYFSIEGVTAEAYASADYSGNYYTDVIDGQFEAYYITRYGDAIDDGAQVSLTGNSVTLYGSPDSDQAQLAAHISAANNSSATSYGNSWYLSLGDGDDNGVIHTAAFAAGAGSIANVSFDTSILIGGGGADTLHASQNLGAVLDAFASMSFTSRQIEGGEGYDSINAGLTIEGGSSGLGGGTATYSYNNVYVDAGNDGGVINAIGFVSAYSGGSANITENNSIFLGANQINANMSISSGSLETAGGFISYSYNELYAEAGTDGSGLYAQNAIFANQGSFVSLAFNITTFIGQAGSDTFNGGIDILSGDGGYGEAWGNSYFVDAGEGSDFVTFTLTSWANAGSSAAICGNDFYGAGGNGDDTLTFNWNVVANGGDAQLWGNHGILEGGAGSDSLFAYLSEGTSGNVITLLGGDGNDTIQTLDWGINNERVLSGGAGNDTIIDDIGFSTAQFEGAFADYTLKALGPNWISVTDNRDGSPDGADQLYQVDQLSFSDGSVLVADLHLPIEGTAGNDTIFGGQGDDYIVGYAGNDTLWGSNGNDTLDGGAGNDLLVGQNGHDTLFGGDGNDQVIGNAGGDRLSGGEGADSFAYGNPSQSSVYDPDLIVDFSGQLAFGTSGQGKQIVVPGQGDKIDLSPVDANTTIAGNQAFTIVQHGFSGTAGELYSGYDAAAGITSIFLDVDGDAIADMQIELLGQVKLTGADYIL